MMKKKCFVIITALAVVTAVLPIDAEPIVSDNSIERLADEKSDIDVLSEKTTSEEVSNTGAIDTKEAEGTCGDDLCWTIVGDDNYGYVLTISGSGEMYNYKSSDKGNTVSLAPWSDYSDKRVRLVIDPGVTSIGSWAFSNMNIIGGLKIPDSVTTLGNGAFYRSGIHGKLAIGRGVTAIPSDCFKDCFIRGDLVIRSNVKSVGSRAFMREYDMESLNMGKIVLEDGIERIGDSAFYDIGRFKSGLILPNSVNFVGNSAFAENYFDGDVQLSSGLTTITNESFRFESNGGLIIPDGVVSIGMNAFSNNKGFKGDLVIPDTVTYISMCAFNETGFDGSLKLSKNLKVVERQAFACADFTGTLELPEGLITIYSYAFSGLDFMTGDVIIPEGVKTVSDGVFLGNNMMRGRVVVPSTVTSMSWATLEGSYFTIIENNADMEVPLYDGDEPFYPGCKWVDEDGNEIYEVVKGVAFRVNKNIIKRVLDGLEPSNDFYEVYEGDLVDKRKIDLGPYFEVTYEDGSTETYAPPRLKPYEFEVNKNTFSKGRNTIIASYTYDGVTLSYTFIVDAKERLYKDEFTDGESSENIFAGDVIMVNGGSAKHIEARRTRADRSSYSANSTDKKVAVITKSGVIKAVGEGSCTISVEKADKTYIYNVTVTEPGFRIKKKYMNSGDSYKLDFIGTDLKVNYSIPKNMRKIAEVDEYGVVTAKKKGVATITASVGGKKYKAKVYVYNPAIKSTKSNVISVGRSKKLKVINGAKGTKWISENPAVATVSSTGKVTGISAGRVRILAYNNGIELSKEITVN